MFLNGCGRWLLVAALSATCVAVAQAQSSAEYGAATSNSATGAAAAKAPFPKISLPAGATTTSGAATPPAASSNATSVPIADKAAANNRLILEKKAGPDAADVSLRSTPDHALVWIDMQFVGATPMQLKLAAGQHRLRMSAPNMQAANQDLDLQAKQPQDVLISLKPRIAENAADQH
jgi:hypothetical protein